MGTVPDLRTQIMFAAVKIAAINLRPSKYQARAIAQLSVSRIGLPLAAPLLGVRGN